MYSWLYISLHHLFLNKTFWRNHTKPNFPPTSKLPKTSPRCLFVPNIPIFFGVQLRSAPGKFLEVHLGRWMTTHQRWDVFFQWASRTVRSPLVSISRKRTANCDKVGFVFSKKCGTFQRKFQFECLCSCFVFWSNNPIVHVPSSEPIVIQWHLFVRQVGVALTENHGHLRETQQATVIFICTLDTPTAISGLVESENLKCWWILDHKSIFKFGGPDCETSFVTPATIGSDMQQKRTVIGHSFATSRYSIQVN